MTKASPTSTERTIGAACAAPIPPGIQRVVAPGVELKYPAVFFATRRVFELLGESDLRRLVRRHHERLRDSRIGHLFAADPRGIRPIRNKDCRFCGRGLRRSCAVYPRELWKWLESMSIRMINRRTTKEQPARWPFERVRTTLEGRDAAVGSTVRAPAGSHHAWTRTRLFRPEALCVVAAHTAGRRLAESCFGPIAQLLVEKLLPPEIAAVFVVQRSEITPDQL